ncbi:GreA/GreB family elongation factor [Streptomyces sp. NPDC094032]|uniref:GreA/GreB family elongation factor n=1 Tax=Streptomyces sp. NPDC094032 TaxID=3155308 RepID=UPI003317B021
MTDGPEPISADDLRELERELTELRAARGKVAATLPDDDMVGDHADAAEELDRATEVTRLDQRITEIEARLRTAPVAGPPPADTVGLGSTVTVRFADGAESTVTVGELAEAPDLNLVTADSPLGRALLGHGAGDTVTYRAPEGPTTATVVSLGPPAPPA